MAACLQIPGPKRADYLISAAVFSFVVSEAAGRFRRHDHGLPARTSPDCYAGPAPRCCQQRRTARRGEFWHAETMVSSVAVLSDIHGVMPALDAVLAEPDLKRADRIVLTGDIAAGP